MVKRLKRRDVPIPKPVDKDEVEAALARMKDAVSDADDAMLRAMLDAEPSLRAELEATRESIARLRKLMKKKQRARGDS